MTIIDAAAQSKTLTRAWGDLVDGYRRRELWLHLGWQDIKQRYRRSVLGPFWITIATGTTAVAMGGLYSKLFHLQLSVHLPYVTLGLIIWNLINASILEGAEVFVANEGLIKQLPTPLSVHVYRLVWRQMILFAHNIVIYLVIAIIFPKPWSWADLSVIPALGLIVLNCVWVSLCFGILATRYRDIGPLLFSIVQLLFFMTPIIWNDDTLRQQGAGAWSKIVELNPLLHYLDIVRAPLLGAHQELRHWAVVVGLTIVGWVLAAFAMRQYRARVAYWVYPDGAGFNQTAKCQYPHPPRGNNRRAAFTVIEQTGRAKVSEGIEPSGLSDEARERVATELARLRERRDRLEAEVRNDRGAVGDHADAADAIQRAEELAGLDERVAELDRLLHAGPAPSNGPDTLPGGTAVTLRFSDGAVVKMQVISVIEEASIAGEAEALTPGSPLGLALVGRKAGDTVTYTTPQGEERVELLELKHPA